MNADQILKRDAELRAQAYDVISDPSDIDAARQYLTNIAAAVQRLIAAVRAEYCDDEHLADSCNAPICVAYRALLTAMEEAQR